ncbi:MAG: glycyl-radical enzyme activating protein [Firmicutes bacterium]|jgi:pyruvate formate lyase activating enzyme|nr:glycyl-radical enzyme activating protein [Bacillota bacterium]
MTGVIFDIKKFSIHDGPGIRTTVFFKGCPLQCIWCHNPEGQDISPEIMFSPEKCSVCGECISACPNQAIIMSDISFNTGKIGPHNIYTLREKCKACGECVAVCPESAREIAGKIMTPDEVMDEILKDVVFYDTSGGGATFSGGEPLLQPGFLLTLLKECKEKEIHTTVDTCGFAEWETLSSVIPYTDLFLYDLKCMDPDKHYKFIGSGNEVILENLRRLYKEGCNIIVRFPLIPAINDDARNITLMGRFLSSLGSGGKLPRIDILPYHKMGFGKYPRLGKIYGLPDIEEPEDETIRFVASRLKEFGLEVRIGGK